MSNVEFDPGTDGLESKAGVQLRFHYSVCPSVVARIMLPTPLCGAAMRLPHKVREGLENRSVQDKGPVVA